MNNSLPLRVKRPLKPVSNAELAACPNWARAMQETVALSGYTNEKALAAEVDIDPGQFTKTKAGELGIRADKFDRLMDACGTEFPLLWLCYQRGYDIEAMRQRETELQRQVRELTDQLSEARKERAVIASFIKETRASA